MGSNACFFYGTLTHPAILSRVIHGPSNPTFNESNTYVQTRPAILPAHRRHRVRYADYPGVVPDETPGACVRGTLATGLTDNDVRRLDIFEGSEYTRQAVKVKVIDGGEEVTAETYIWTAPRSQLEDQEWDYDTFVREKLKLWLPGGQKTAEEFGALDAEAVDGTRGRALGGDMARQLEQAEGEAIKSAV